MRVAPIHTSFLLSSILGVLVSIFYIYPRSTNWGFAFAIVFTCMFIAAFLSMSRAAPDDQLRATPKR